MQKYNPPPIAEVLPAEFQKSVDKYITFVLGEEKKAYKNDLKPFALHAEQVKNDVHDKCCLLQKRLRASQKLLKERFTQEEVQNPLLAQEFTLDTLQSAVQKFENLQKNKETCPTSFRALQTELEIPWSFMDRVFQTGKELLQGGNFEGASDVFFFLRFLQPRVFDYWVCEATCLHELGKLEEAIAIYENSLMFQPKNPLVFFQMASCLFRIGELSRALEGFEKCLQAASEEPRYADLYKEALQIRAYLREKK